MRGMGTKGSLVAFAVVLGLSVVSPAGAYFAGGGKDADKGNDCLIGYDGIDASDVTLDGKKQVVSCTDCDPSCDFDGEATANGSCTFQVGVCINQAGVGGCTPPAGLSKAKASAKVKGVKGKIDIQVPQLLEGSVCGALLDLDVPVKETKKGQKDGNGDGQALRAGEEEQGRRHHQDAQGQRQRDVRVRAAPRGRSVPAASTTTTSTTVARTTTTSTTLSLCGNGAIDGSEECDDGNANDGDGCTRACTLCGNGTVTSPETCETPLTCTGGANDGNACTTAVDCPGGFCTTKNIAGCDANCTLPACGNGNVSGSETCDDGNTSDEDACPADCIIDACTPQAGTDLTVQVNFAGSDQVAGITVFLDYPEGEVNIPGSGADISAGIITDLPGFAFGQSNDLDHALIQAVVDVAAFPSGLLFNIHFETCAGAPAPTAGEFTCIVQSAGDVNLNPVPGVTCSVNVP